jgi:hypothetical protein
MADTDRQYTYVKETPVYVPEKTSGSGGLAFIVGALVVVVGLIAWFVWGDGQSHVGSTDTSNTTVTIQTPEPAAPAQDVAPAPAAPAAPAQP